MKLDYLCDYTATFITPISVGKGPLGERIVADLTGGHFEGPRMKGKVRASGADWALVGPDGNLRLDVRAVFESDDGARFMSPTGRVWKPPRGFGKRLRAVARPISGIIILSHRSSLRPATSAMPGSII